MFMSIHECIGLMERERLYKLSGFGRQVVLNMAITKQLIREARHKE